jgi:hypothetical protein
MPVINGVYLKDFPALPGAVEDANIIPIAITGNQISYRTTVSGIVTDARVTSKLLTGLSVTGGAVVATDTILQAFGKVQNQINGKQETITLTTLGTSGEATLIGSTLNIPNYADGGVLSVGAIGASPNANAATITGTVLNLEPASASFGGVVTTGTQAFAGFKTFGNSGSDNTVNIDHTSGAGIGLTITKGGNGEGLIVNKTGGSGNAVTVTGGTTSLQELSGTSAVFSSSVTATTLTLSSNSNLITGTPVTNTNRVATIFSNLSGNIVFGANGNNANDLLGNSGTYQALIGTTLNNSFGIGTNNSVRYTISETGDNTWTGSGTFAGIIYTNAENAITAANAGTARRFGIWANTSGSIVWGVESSVGGTLLTGSSPYAAIIGSNTGGGDFSLGTNGATRLTLAASTGAATFTSSVTASSLIKSGGTSSQFLKADGSVDSTAYGTGSVTSVAALTLGTTGTDLSSSVANGTTTPVITLNVPTASASNRGALSAADWTTFNNKTSNTGTVTSVGLSSATSGVTIGSTPVTTSGTITLAIATASGSQNGLLSSTDWTTFNNKQSALTNPVTGTGTTNTLPKFTGSTTIGDSAITDDGTTVTLVSRALTGTSATFASGVRSWNINPASAFITHVSSGVVEAQIAPSSGDNSWLGATSGTTGTGAKHYFGSTGNYVAAGSITGTSATFSSTATAIAFIPSGATVPTNGMYLSAANTLNFATNTTNRLSISSTGSATFTGGLTTTITADGVLSATTASTSRKFISIANTGAGLNLGIENSAGGDLATGTSAYAAVIASPPASRSLQFATTNTVRLTIDAAGAATFSSTLGINGTANNVTSGTYTPTLTNVLNVSGASNVGDAQYKRIGNIVTVYGSVSFTMSASGNCEIDISLPIASNFSASTQAHGMGVTFKTNCTNAVVSSDATNDRVSLTFVANSADTSDFRYSFSYSVL